MVDELLLWIRSGYSWQELETTGGWHLGTRDLAVERELRARGFDTESSCREIEVAGSQVSLAEFLEDDALGNGRPMLLAEKLEWLEQTGRVPNWSAALA